MKGVEKGTFVFVSGFVWTFILGVGMAGSVLMAARSTGTDTPLARTRWNTNIAVYPNAGHNKSTD
jgi:hypothetical protein